MSENKNIKARTALINKVQERCKHLDAVAQSAAIEAVRRPDDQSVQHARQYVFAADALCAAGRDITEYIHAFWPNEEE